jgi:hypothetical protein
MPQSFTNSEQFLQYMQQTYGSANFAQWQSMRQQFYSFVNYPAAGGVVFNFFGFAASGNAGQNQQYTNLQKAGSFGQQFLLLKSIQCAYYVSNAQNLFTAALVGGVYSDTSNASIDFIAGLFQAGYFELDIGSKPYVQVPKPFLYLPPADGETMNVATLGVSGTTAGTVFTAYHSIVAFADLNTNQHNRYLVDPAILIEAEQALTCTIGYPTGAIPLISSTIFTNNFFIGVILDGVLFRPQQ